MHYSLNMAKDRSHLTPTVRTDKNNVARTVYVKPVPNSVDKLRMVPPVSMSDSMYDLTDNDYESSGGDPWGTYGFDEREADDWAMYGFDDPNEAANWRRIVHDPDLASDLKFNNVPIGFANRWMQVREACAGAYTFDELVTMTGTTRPDIAEEYAKHFDPEHWAMAARAGVNTKTAQTVAYLVSSIALMQDTEDTEAGTLEAFHTASVWAKATAKPDPKRMQIIDSCIRRNIPLQKATNILGDTDDTSIYPDIIINDETVDRALKADAWVERAKYKKEPEAISAYRSLFTSLQADAESTQRLVDEHGVKKVVESLSLGFTPTQAEHYLQQGGVAEISKGVL